MEVPQNISVWDLFPADEGSINQYSGQIGSGKTYAATADILTLLKRGQVVYANWALRFDGLDDRNDKFLLFLRALGLPVKFFVFPKDNFHYVEPKHITPEFISSLTDCHLFLDEGHIYLNSYEKTAVSMEKLTMIYSTRHYNRTINIISQRQTAIHVSARANVNRFYRCEQHSIFGLIRWFSKSEYQDLGADEKIDLDSEPVSVKNYFPSKKIFEAYDTKYLRGSLEISQRNYIQLFSMSVSDAWRRLFLRDKK